MCLYDGRVIVSRLTEWYLRKSMRYLLMAAIVRPPLTSYLGRKDSAWPFRLNFPMIFLNCGHRLRGKAWCTYPAACCKAARIVRPHVPTDVRTPFLKNYTDHWSCNPGVGTKRFVSIEFPWVWNAIHTKTCQSITH